MDITMSRISAFNNRVILSTSYSGVLVHLSPPPLKARTATSARAHQYFWKNDFSTSGACGISLPSASTTAGLRRWSFGVGPDVGRRRTTFRFDWEESEAEDGERGSAEKDAAKTKLSLSRWRVRVCLNLGLKAGRLVIVVEP